MALVECSECGNQVSEKAEACPQCGSPIGDGAKSQPAAAQAAQPAAAQPESASKKIFAVFIGCGGLFFLFWLLGTIGMCSGAIEMPTVNVNAP